MLRAGIQTPNHDFPMSTPGTMMCLRNYYAEATYFSTWNNKDPLLINIQCNITLLWLFIIFTYLFMTQTWKTICKWMTQMQWHWLNPTRKLCWWTYTAKTNCQQKHFNESPSMDFNLLFQKTHPAFREINCQNDVALILDDCWSSLKVGPPR